MSRSLIENHMLAVHIQHMFERHVAAESNGYIRLLTADMPLADKSWVGEYGFFDADGDLLGRNTHPKVLAMNARHKKFTVHTVQ